MARPILVADHDAQSRRTLAALLAGAGFEVAEAHSGASALELVQWRRFELFVIDARMAPMSGDALVERLRWRGLTAPVVMVGAVDADARDATRAVRHVRAPIDPTALVAAVTVALASATA